MTIERRIIFDLAEIQSVIFECKDCGARVSLRPGKAHRPPENCPAGHAWHWNVDTGFRSTESPFIALLSSVARLQDPVLQQMGFLVFLEIDGVSARVSDAS